MSPCSSAAPNSSSAVSRPVPRAARQRLEAEHGPVLEQQDRLVRRDHPLADDEVQQPFPHLLSLAPPLVGS